MMANKWNHGKKKKDSDSDNDDFDFDNDEDDITESKESSQPSIEKKLSTFSRSTTDKLDVDDVIKKLLTNKVRNIGLSGEVTEETIIKIIETARDIVTQ